MPLGILRAKNKPHGLVEQDGETYWLNGTEWQNIKWLPGRSKPDDKRRRTASN